MKPVFGRISDLLVLVFLSAFTFSTQNLFASTSWPNEPAGSTPLFDCGFDQAFVQDARDPNYFTTCDGKLRDPLGTNRYSLSRQQDPTAPFSPSSVIRSTRFANVASGGTSLEYSLPNGTKEIYAAFWWRTSVPFTGKNHGSNKMFFIRGQSPGTNGYFCLDLPPGTSTGSLSWRTQMPNNLDQCGGAGYDQDVCRGNISNVPIKIGEWYRIEVYMKASTCATCHDGIARWWINGTLAGNYLNFAYGPAVDVWLWSETWDGSGPANEWITEAYHQLDHLRISAPNGMIDPVIPLSISTGALSAGRLGVAYSATLQAANGKAPYGWTITSGSLLPGLSLNKTTGVISGTPTACGRSNFTVKVMDSSVPAGEATKSFYIIASGTNCPSSIGEVTSTPTTKNAQLQITAHSGKAHFDIPIAAGEYRLSVYDFAGKKVFEHRSMGQKEMSPAKSLKNGVYLAKFTQGTQSGAFRFHVMN